VRSITVFGRRWFQHGPGNTYCTAAVLVNGEVVGRVERTYGYGTFYEQAAWNLLEAKGLVPGWERYANGMREPAWAYCKRLGIAYHYEAADVARRGDL
jgi:hypothetical protein